MIGRIAIMNEITHVSTPVDNQSDSLMVSSVDSVCPVLATIDQSLF